MQLKICGMRNPQNITDIAALNPDYLGFIFYEKSKRYVGEDFDEAATYHLPTEKSPRFRDTAGQAKGIKKIGVFVNASMEYVLSKVKRYGLDLVQLHGEESPEFCRDLQRNNIPVIKVFAVGQTFDFSVLEPYKPHCNYFLFDTKGKEKGGNGMVFNWEVLKDYDNEKPFFLSGGLSLENVGKVKELQSLNIVAIDVNSGFEVAPALKDVEKVKQLMQVI
jgi:phosphoribosylanthranilate isomerase